MTGVTWLVLTYVVTGVFLFLFVGRLISIARRPEHLRWELAPVPKDKGKTGYGGSYLEDFEWWKKPRAKTTIAPIGYMLREILSLKTFRTNNPSLWPFSLALHYGIYCFILTLILHLTNSILLINGGTPGLLKVIVTITFSAGVTLGITGATGLIMKRLLDRDLRPYSAPASFFKLILLLALFGSGAAALLFGKGYAGEMGQFVKGVIVFDTSITVSGPAASHLLISYLFLLALPLTNMIHMVTKHFTYYAVRWNDNPLDARLYTKLAEVSQKQGSWSSVHAGGNISQVGQAGENSEKN